MVMEAPNFWHRNHLTRFRWFHGARLWTIHIERQMRAKLVVISPIIRQELPEVLFVSHDDMGIGVLRIL
jgi:hypothetical protein